MPSFSDLCGYVPNPAATALIVSALTTPELPRRMLYHEDRNICLLDAVLKCKPSWQRGKQTIGDCVSWGAEGACTTIEACQAVSGQSGWEEEVATEAIYGLRVESDNGASWDDGWFGAGAAKAVKDYGVVLRKDYSQDTGNPETDLRVYDGQKAKQWGYYGCGGQNDNGKLDAITKKHPVKDTTLIKSVEEAAAAIQHGCPVTVASNVGYGDMQRDSQGVVRASGQWGHQMCFVGVQYIGGKPYLQLMQSWGNSCRGPFPNVTAQAIQACTWLCHPDDAGEQISAGDSFAYSAVEGFTQPIWNPDNIWT